MRYAKDMNGKFSPWVRKYQIGETISNLGAPLVAMVANDAGLKLATTTTITNMIGISLSNTLPISNAALTYVTAQQTDFPTNKAERLVSVCVNPYAVYSMLFSGGATDGTALTEYDVTTASTDGLTVTTGDSWTSPEFDEGTVFFWKGANAGQFRKITSTSATAATVTVAFESDIVVGDVALRIPYTPCQSTTVQLTSNVLNANAAIAVGTGANMRCVELHMLDLGGDPDKTRSSGVFFPASHFFR